MTLLALAAGWTLWCLGEILAVMLWLPVSAADWLEATSYRLRMWAANRDGDLRRLKGEQL